MHIYNKKTKLKHLNQIFEKLKLTKESGLFLSNEPREKLFSNRIEKLLRNNIKPNALFCIDNKPLILFFENLKEDKSKKLKDIWNFNETPIVIIAEAESVEIYNGYNFLLEEDSLELIGGNNALNDFTYIEMVTGRVWNKYESNLSSNNRVDYHLLRNVKFAKKLLLKEGLSQSLINALVGKFIFIRYLIDREVKLDFENTGTSRAWDNRELLNLLANKDSLKSFFSYLKSKFNGGLFPISEEELESVTSQAFEVLSCLLAGEDLDSGQRSLFDLYDFSIIPVEFISNIYEVFIGEDNQEKQGAYYTPLFLVDYILNETVESKLAHSKSASCKVLDPSCGSGIFLVETLRKIIEKYQGELSDNSFDSVVYKDKLKELARDNIFGVDKDPNAINVAIFSIYLTLLDYQNPSDVESFRFPNLLDTNFFVADFFDTEAKFNEVFSKINFDFIIGNPPWRRGLGDSSEALYLDYIKVRSKKENANDIARVKKLLVISNKEIAQAFSVRTSDFSSVGTKIALVLTSKILYNINAAQFRKYFLQNFTIDKVLELSPVRKEIFNNSNDKAVAPAAVLFYRYDPSLEEKSNIIEHISLKPSNFFSLFKIFSIQREDYKQVEQRYLEQNDYLWKVLVYGNYLDFNLIKKLKTKFSSINELISDDNRFSVGQGIQVRGDKNDSSHYIGKPYLNARRDIEAFWVNQQPIDVWEKDYAHRPKIPELFMAPMLLINKGVKNTFRCSSAYTEQSAVFSDAITSVSAKSVGDIESLKSVSGILNSSLFAYFNLQTFSSTGIEREQAHNEEKFAMPFLSNANISSKYEELSKLVNKKRQEDILVSGLDSDITAAIEELDSLILDAFGLSQQERALVEYANSVTIPLLMKPKERLQIISAIRGQEKILIDYAQLFISTFNKDLSSSGLKLKASINISPKVIGVFFSVVDNTLETEAFSFTDFESDVLVNRLVALGVEKLTDQLFVRKDIRGFERNGFYIVKPNERKLWHQAIANLDVGEFMDAALVAGKKRKFDV